MRPKNRRHGFILVTVVVSTVALLACIGLAVDVGYLQLVKTRMQTAADAAALGGVQERRQNGASGVVNAARFDAGLNRFTDGEDTVAVTVNSPPAGGFYTADSTAVEVLISQDVQTLFMGVLGFHSVNVRARSVARQGSGTSCLYTLDPNAASAFSITGGATLTVGCGIEVASTSATAMVSGGGAHLTATSISVAGGYQPGGGVVVTPTPSTHVAAEGDPLAYLTPPAVGACWKVDWKAGNGLITSITPGVYCGGITMNGGATVTMSPGTYILVGGGLNVSNGAKLIGEGVTFYNTYNAQHPYHEINLLGGTTLQLSAPTTGPLAGILFYQDRTVASPPASTFSNGTTLTFDGALYFPTSALIYSGGASTNYTILVSKTISFSGGTTLNSNYASLPGGSPVKGNAALCE